MRTSILASRGLLVRCVSLAAASLLGVLMLPDRPAMASIPDCRSGWVALTYDDGPVSLRTEFILDALDTARVSATFFTIGYLVRAYPETVKTTADRGHAVANHTDAHENLQKLSAIGIRNTISRADAAIRAAGVTPVKLLRPPGGNSNASVKSAIASAGYVEMLWSVDPQDWRGNSAAEIHDEVVNRAKDGSVILLHDADSNYENTAAATLTIISTLHQQGFCFGVLDANGDIAPADWNVQKVGPFYDVAGSVFSADILWLYDQGIGKGCNPPLNNRYCPSEAVTRGQMAAMISRAIGLTPTSGVDPFTDDDDSIFEADIEKLAAAGITKGCNPPDNTLFCPDAKVTREQMAAFLVRALMYTDNGGGDLFIDDDDSIFENDIDKLATAGVTKGCNPPLNDRYCPDGHVTRGQMAAFLHRALG